MSKKILYDTIFIIIIALLILLLEILLKSLNIGINTDVFIYNKDIKQYNLNKSLINKYYPVSTEEFFEQEKVLIKKEKNNYIKSGFILGASTAEGFPFYSNNSFSKILENSMNYSANDTNKYEIYNLGFSAMSSYYVSDVAKKLIKYKPDFIIIYSGHNEYYGNVTAKSKISHIKNKIYLFIKEYRIIQLIMRLTNFKKKYKSDKTLMEIQYNKINNYYNENVDKKICDNFINNIDEIVHLYSKKNIPVIIIDPISNIIDMPPFKGVNDDRYFNEIIEYKETIDSANEKDIKTYNNKIEDINKDNNANMIYLNAKAKYKLNDNSEDVEKYYIKAKDYDCIPFRARSVLNKRLKEYINNTKNNKNVYYIDLYDSLKRDYGFKIFSNMIFADHLHFNDEGNILLSFNIIKTLKNIYKLSSNKINIFYNENRGEIYKNMKYSPLSQYVAYRKIDNLLNSQIYTNQILHYEYVSILKHNNPIVLDENLLNKMSSLEIQYLYSYYTDYYLSKGDFKEYLDSVNSFELIYPGYYKNYILYAKYLILKQDFNNVKRYLSMAYLLSNKNKNVKKEILALFKFNIDEYIKIYKEEILKVL